MKRNNLFKAIGIVILAFVLITWIMPIIYSAAGVDTAKEPISFQVGIASILSVITEAFSGFGAVVLFVLLVGGFYGVLKCTGAYDKMMDSVLACSNGKEKKSLIIIIISLALISSVSGLELGLLVLFPFLLGYITKMGYSKLVAIASTVGATIIGMYGSVFAGTFYGLNSQVFGVGIYSQILFKIIFLVVGLAALLFFVLRVVKKDKVRVSSRKAVNKKECLNCTGFLNYAVVFAFGYSLAGLIGSIITGGVVKIVVLAILFALFTILAILMLRKSFEKSKSFVILAIVFLLLGAVFALSTLGVTPLFMDFAVQSQIFIESAVLLLLMFFIYVISRKGRILCDDASIYFKVLCYSIVVFGFGYLLAGLIGAIITGGLIKIVVLATLFIIFTTFCVLMICNNKNTGGSKAANKIRKIKKVTGIFDYKKSFIVFAILFLVVGALFGLSTLGVTPLFMKYAVANQIVIESVILLILALVLVIYVCKKAQIKEFKALPAFIICGVLFLLMFLGTTVWNDIFGVDWFATAHSSWTGFKIAGFDILHKIVGVTTTQGGTSDVISAFGSWSDPNRFKVYSLLLIFAMAALSIVYKKNIKESFDGFADGIKSFVVPAILVVLIYSVFVFSFYSPVVSTVTGHLLGNSFNVLLAGIYVIINSIVSVDYYYFTAILGATVAQKYTDPTELSIISVMFVNLYSLVMLVAPTSVLLMIMLSISEVKYTDWFKFIWKLALALLLISFIVFVIMLAI